MEEIYDLAILGAGPAGICAAIYATRGKLNTLWLEKKFVQGGQIVDTYEVDNYPGLPGITGLPKPYQEKILDRSTIIKYNFLINYENITEKIISEKKT